MQYKTVALTFFSLTLLFAGCSRENSSTNEEIRLVADTTTTGVDSTSSIVLSASTLMTYPNEVLLTGLKDQRLVTIYRKVQDANKNLIEEYAGNSSSYYYGDETRSHYSFFMPGINLQLGYNLVNIAHYNFKTEKTKMLFERPALIRSIYYPSFEQDSLNKKPINRNYFFVSVYNEDTNLDTLLNKGDLRRFFMFNADASEQKLMIPADYSVVRSQYDSANDVMYIFARHDANNDGRSQPTEPLHVFWISLANPGEGTRLY
ncbi:MAG TPA: hypothetical protein VGD65_00015 [Chryseosolibacter sp.]